MNSRQANWLPLACRKFCITGRMLPSMLTFLPLSPLPTTHTHTPHIYLPIQPHPRAPPAHWSISTSLSEDGHLRSGKRTAEGSPVFEQQREKRNLLDSGWRDSEKHTADDCASMALTDFPQLVARPDGGRRWGVGGSEGMGYGRRVGSQLASSYLRP